MISSNTLNQMYEKLHNLDSAYNACVNYIDYVNNCIENNEHMFMQSLIPYKQYDETRKTLNKQVMSLNEDAKKYHKKSFLLRQKISNMNENTCF